MYIIHCLKEKTWDEYKSQKYYGEESLNRFGFIHCSEITTYQWVAPNFKNETDNLVLLVIDTDKVESKVVWEDLSNCSVAYPHIYGLLNTDAVVEAVPHLWSDKKEWIINEELLKYETQKR
ncbi:MAG: DUF952 domain-containing protein [Acutalibacteraceae bacterium]